MYWFYVWRKIGHTLIVWKCVLICLFLKENQTQKKIDHSLLNQSRIKVCCRWSIHLLHYSSTHISNSNYKGNFLLTQYITGILQKTSKLLYPLLVNFNRLIDRSPPSKKARHIILTVTLGILTKIQSNLSNHRG